MTRRITVSLPDEIADRVELETNSSRYVADAIRARMSREDTYRMLADAGFSDLPPERIEAVKAELLERLSRVKASPGAAANAARIRAARGAA